MFGSRRNSRFSGARFARTRRGFTIIELLIVVIVIGILAAAGLAKYQNFAETSRRKTCIAQLKQIETALAVWETNYASFAENAKTSFALTPRTGRLTSPQVVNSIPGATGTWSVGGTNVLQGGSAPGAMTDPNQATVGAPSSFFNSGPVAAPTGGPLSSVIRDDNVWVCPSAVSRYYGGEVQNVPDDFLDIAGSGVPSHSTGTAIGEHGRYVVVVAGRGDSTLPSLNNKGFAFDLLSDVDGGGNASNPSPCPQVPFKITVCGSYGKFGQGFTSGTPNVPGTSATYGGGCTGPDGSPLSRHSARW